jgi:hypothetical protein
MRQKLNNNPLVQVAVLGVLLLATGFFVISTMGGGGGEEEAAAPSEATVSEPSAAVPPEGELAVSETVSGAATVAPPPPGALADAAPPPPRQVVSAFESGQTVVLLFVRDGGIDDRLVAGATRSLGALPGVTAFVVPAGRIARYAQITQGVEVNRVPALIVLRPKRVGGSVPTASVHYGFQSPANVVQAVTDAGYRGPNVDYHP